ncbi:MAG: hypothetical protein ABEL76_13635 [Bradymonadaceae bacterium]
MVCRFLLCWCICLPFATAGCGEAIDSKKVKTSGIWLDAEATARDSESIQISTALRTGGPNSNTYVDLSGGDELVYYIAGRSVEPTRTSPDVGQKVRYVASVDENRAGLPIRIAFKRSHDGDDCKGFGSATETMTTMPPPFSITSPTDGTSIGRDEAIQVDIDSPSDERTTASIAADCLEGSYQRKLTDGSATFPAGTLALDDDEETPDTCEAELTVERSRPGQVDSNFKGGRFPGRQIRRLTFETTP